MGSNGTTSIGLRTPPHPHLPDPYADIRAEARALRDNQRLSLASAAAALVTAAALAADRARTPREVAAVLGAWLLVAGALHLVEAMLPAGGTQAARALAGTGGLLYVSVGAGCVRGLWDEAQWLAVALGIAWLAGGIAAVVAAVTGSRGGWALRGAVGTGVVTAAAGLALTFWPAATGPTVCVVALALLSGVGALHLSLALRAARPAAC
ncbi:MAG TPA: hypothetical protein VFY17_04785 [Pilimelia sp.]|nr:hypothetical protein [Pilimelia sp.]